MSGNSSDASDLKAIFFQKSKVTQEEFALIELTVERNAILKRLNDAVKDVNDLRRELDDAQILKTFRLFNSLREVTMRFLQTVAKWQASFTHFIRPQLFGVDYLATTFLQDANFVNAAKVRKLFNFQFFRGNVLLLPFQSLALSEPLRVHPDLGREIRIFANPNEEEVIACYQVLVNCLPEEVFRDKLVSLGKWLAESWTPSIYISSRADKKFFSSSNVPSSQKEKDTPTKIANNNNNKSEENSMSSSQVKPMKSALRRASSQTQSSLPLNTDTQTVKSGDRRASRKPSGLSVQSSLSLASSVEGATARERATPLLPALLENTQRDESHDTDSVSLAPSITAPSRKAAAGSVSSGKRGRTTVSAEDRDEEEIENYFQSISTFFSPKKVSTFATSSSTDALSQHIDTDIGAETNNNGEDIQLGKKLLFSLTAKQKEKNSSTAEKSSKNNQISKEMSKKEVNNAREVQKSKEGDKQRRPRTESASVEENKPRAATITFAEDESEQLAPKEDEATLREEKGEEEDGKEAGDGDDDRDEDEDGEVDDEENNGSEGEEDDEQTEMEEGEAEGERNEENKNDESTEIDSSVLPVIADALPQTSTKAQTQTSASTKKVVRLRDSRRISELTANTRVAFNIESMMSQKEEKPLAEGSMKREFSKSSKSSKSVKKVVKTQEETVLPPIPSKTDFAPFRKKSRGKRELALSTAAMRAWFVEQQETERRKQEDAAYKPVKFF